MLAVFCVDACKRNLRTDAKSCLNSVGVYESCNTRKENETCSGWSLNDGRETLNDRRELLCDQQTADIIWYFQIVVCNYDLILP